MILCGKQGIIPLRGHKVLDEDFSCKSWNPVENFRYFAAILSFSLRGDDKLCNKRTNCSTNAVYWRLDI